MAELTPVDGKRRAGEHWQTGDQNELREPSHPILRCRAVSSRTRAPTNRTEDNSTGAGFRMHAQIMSGVGQRIDAVQNQRDVFLADFTVVFGATFFHARVSALFSVAALAFASRTLV